MFKSSPSFIAIEVRYHISFFVCFCSCFGCSFFWWWNVICIEKEKEDISLLVSYCVLSKGRLSKLVSSLSHSLSLCGCVYVCFEGGDDYQTFFFFLGGGSFPCFLIEEMKKGMDEKQAEVD